MTYNMTSSIPTKKNTNYLQICHFQIKHKTILSTGFGTNLRDVVMPHPYQHIRVDTKNSTHALV